MGDGLMDDRVQEYIETIPAAHRPLFDRVHGVIMEVRPDAHVTMSYGIPTYKVGSARLYLGEWKHGVSIYGWQQGRDGGFVERHPELKKSKGTIQLRPESANAITDDELRDLVRAAFAG
jgi:uncharacterized protein YdhG (YjbR/CyaY superfamily)